MDETKRGGEVLGNGVDGDTPDDNDDDENDDDGSNDDNGENDDDNDNVDGNVSRTHTETRYRSHTTIEA